jgi:hypothetical protein
VRGGASRLRLAFWWAVANPSAWALGWFVSSYVISRNIDERFPIFGASGAIVFGLLNWLLRSLLFRAAPKSRGRRSQLLSERMSAEVAAGILLERWEKVCADLGERPSWRRCCGSTQPSLSLGNRRGWRAPVCSPACVLGCSCLLRCYCLGSALDAEQALPHHGEVRHLDEE